MGGGRDPKRGEALSTSLSGHFDTTETVKNKKGGDLWTVICQVWWVTVLSYIYCYKYKLYHLFGMNMVPLSLWVSAMWNLLVLALTPEQLLLITKSIWFEVTRLIKLHLIHDEQWIARTFNLWVILLFSHCVGAKRHHVSPFALNKQCKWITQHFDCGPLLAFGCAKLKLLVDGNHMSFPVLIPSDTSF